MSTQETTKHHLVTLHGIPVTVELHWPYHPSPSGSDWFVLHGKMSLEDGSGRWAAVSVHLTRTVLEMLKTLDAEKTLAPTLCTVRKAADTKDIEFLKSEKLQPVPMSSRIYSVLTQEFTFHRANAEQIAEYLKRKAYWQKKAGMAATPVTEEMDMLYLGCKEDALLSAAQQLAAKGVIRLEGKNAVVAEGINAFAQEIESVAHKALEEIDAKHAYERTVSH